MDLILAEQFLLLLLDDDKGSDASAYGGDPGLAGALLLDLTHARALAERDGKLEATGSPPPHPLLAEAHAAIARADEARDAKGWVQHLPKELKPLRDRVAGGLVERGVLSEERRKVLGLFGTTRFPQADPEPERALRERLAAVLLRESTPTPEEAMLVALLEPYDQVGKLVPRDRRKEAKATAKALADGGTAAQAVGAALQDVQTAIIVSTVAASSAAVASSTVIAT